MVGKKMVLWITLLLFTATPNLCYGGEEMAIPYSETGAKIWSYLLAEYHRPEVVAGIMGNLWGESNFEYYQCEGQEAHPERSKEYTRQVNNKTISRYEFINFGYNGSKSLKGYGLAQWTTPARKTLLYDTMFNGLWSGIDDLAGQCAVLISEIKNDSSYSPTKNACYSDTSTIEEVAEIFCRNYERPAEVDKRVAERKIFAQQVYETFYGEAPEPIPPTPTPPYAPIPVPYSPIFPQKMKPVYYTNPYLRRIAFRNVYFK